MLGFSVSAPLCIVQDGRACRPLNPFSQPGCSSNSKGFLLLVAKGWLAFEPLLQKIPKPYKAELPNPNP